MTIEMTLPILLLAIPLLFATAFVLGNVAMLLVRARRTAKYAPPRAIARMVPRPFVHDDEPTRVFARAYAP